MKNIFKPEDFIGDETNEDCAHSANTMLNALIEQAPVVYGQGVGAMKSADWCMNGPDTEKYKHTHSARLMFIEELVKEPCQHEPMKSAMTALPRNICVHCGVKIKATWNEVK